jgi:2-methylcitrate dehydratase PrpD
MDAMERTATGTLADSIVGFALGTKSGDITQAARDNAKLLLLETLCIALAGSTLPIGKIISGYVDGSGGAASATLIGGRKKLSPQMAALANGTMAASLDFDGGWHTTTHTMPTALAMVESNRLTGRDLLDAFIVGVEVGKRFTETYDTLRQVKATRAIKESGPSSRGLWHVGIAAPVAAAAIASRVLKLTPDQAAKALGIATCSAGGFRRNMGTMSKGLHAGEGARDGIQAAELAKRGFTSDPGVLDGPLGLLDGVCLPDGSDPRAITERLGRPFALAGMLRSKPYPACSRGQQHLDATLWLLRNETFSIDDIEAIETDLQPFSLLRPEAESEDAAGFSAAYQISAALVFGAFGVDQIGRKALDDPRVRALMKKVRHVSWKEANRLTLRLRGGRVIGRDIQAYRNLKNLEDLQPKLKDCALRAISEKAMAELQDLVLHIDDQPTVDRIATIIRGDT